MRTFSWVILSSFQPTYCLILDYKVKVLFEENNMLDEEHEKLLRKTRERHEGFEGKHSTSVSAKVSKIFLILDLVIIVDIYNVP